MKMPLAKTTVLAAVLAAFIAITASSCGSDTPSDGAGDSERRTEGRTALLLAMAVLGENPDGSPQPLPARLGILESPGAEDEWSYRTLEDPDSNVFHKAMAYPEARDPGLLTFGGTAAVVKLWRANGSSSTLWEEDFGGRFSRMRDAEIGDLYGDGRLSIAVATHDQGVVAVLRPEESGGFVVEELDRQPDTVVHEIEVGDLDGDGTLEIYATPTAPNRVDGTAQPGKVVRYVPAQGEGRVEVADLGDRHAKEILVTDLDGDGRDELYVSVEAVSGGTVEIRQFHADSEPTAGTVVSRLDDRLCRFLTVGDVDGDSKREVVAATYRSGLWLLRPSGDTWSRQRIDADSSGFEHAAILLDLDRDGRDELYVASDNQQQVRRYDWSEDGWQKSVLLEHTDGLGRFTWNLMPAPTDWLPAGR